MQPDQIRAIARLAHLDLTDEELSRFTGQLDGILAAFAKLEDLSLEAPPPAGSIPAAPLREDEVRPFVDPHELVEASEDHADGFFSVPRIL
jgi:aspartyl-tRNA(Asn)/glutamyl-tRNA(Gln) amidotransferase subunit C